MFDEQKLDREKSDEIESKEGVAGTDDSGNKTVNNYTFLKTLGAGATAKVKLCRINSLLYAAKIFRKSFLSRKRQFIPTPDGDVRVETGITELKREIAIMKKLTHRNVIHLHEVIFEEESDKLYIIMDYCEKGPIMEWDEDLERFLFPWDESEISEHVLRKIFRDAVCGLEYLHYNDIVHRDIKPQNMLITDDWTVKLADFGQAHLFNDPNMTNRSLGTYYFYPPECCGDNEVFEPKPTDVWALGMTFYVIIYHKLPFEATSCADIFEQIRTFELKFPEHKMMDSELKFLIERMLDKNPFTRITMMEMIANPWLNRDCNPIEFTHGEKISPTDEEINKAIRPIAKALMIVRII